jgi:hypothetical protein
MIVRTDYSDDLAEKVFILAFQGKTDSFLASLGVSDVEVFKAILKNANFIFMLPCGLCWMEGTTPQKTEIHFVFWSKEIFRLLPEMGKTLDLFHEKTGIGRISTMIPEGNRVLKRMVTEMGFEYEGTMRNIWRLADGTVISSEVYAKIY